MTIISRKFDKRIYYSNRGKTPPLTQDRVDAIRIEFDKYYADTGKCLYSDLGIKHSAERILGYDCGKVHSIKEAWNIIKSYAGRDIVDIIDKEYSKDAAKRFYSSVRWQSLRVHIIEEQKGRCQMCGASYKEDGIKIHVDHIVPLSVDWSRRLDKNNLQLLCEACNLGKGNKYTTDWRK